MPTGQKFRWWVWKPRRGMRQGGPKFSGIELDPEYFETACDRIRKAYAEPDMLVETNMSKLAQTNMDL